MASPIIDFMLSRASAPIQDLGEPGPDDSQIELMLKVATHVPDHGRLAPWRFILYRGAARQAIGEGLVALAETLEGPLPEMRREKERSRFTYAPLVIGIVSVPKAHPKIPDWEKFLSGGAAAMNMLLAAEALGFGANWLTGWYADLPEGRALLGLAPEERVVGFVHVGTRSKNPSPRLRPDPESVKSDYAGPYRA